MRYSIRNWIASLMALIALAGSTTGHAEGIVDANTTDESLIGGLADVGDMRPMSTIGIRQPKLAAGDAAPEGVRASIRANVRQSVPTRDRAATYRTAEVFRNSKVVLPLLVADLEPQVIVLPQPMSGLSVGAPPAAAWTTSAR